ncbi:hypothetical protein [Sphingomonas sp. S2-65]|uniref:hypothetical protein n=1 Tax=Sphingomonas sp. S2-65 TaxID=2903960 RepID=UPI001F28A0A3|nr:hypothetical protein [Sphingomonas sp. S2-65]UYY59846.1 hypothetical protein LZ586_07100 [Sphingomonas sp. S2-65]
MQDQPRLRSDLAIRATGLGLAASGGLALAELCRLANQPPHHPASVLEFALACAAFLGLALGGALLTLGAGMFAQIEVSPRWRTNPAPRFVPNATRPPASPGPDIHAALFRHAA